jgi:Leucine-rich repeat (LRR) protein
LNLTNIALKGTIPSEMAGLTSLLLLDLSKNAVTGTLPSQLAQMSTLTDLFLRENKLVGSIPTEFGNFASLRLLHLGQNQLNGKIPNTLKRIDNLKALALDKNQLSGSIPDLSELKKLGELSWTMTDESTGNFRYPSRFCQLRLLTKLRVSFLLLHTAILYLDENKITGELPFSFTKLTGLVDLRLSNNQISGTMPPGFETFVKLRKYTM